MSALDDSTYRVDIDFDTKQVEVVCFGMNSVDTEVEGHYGSTNELPKWMQEKLAVLSMLRVPPPPNDVVGLGSRIGPYLYWVYK